MKKQVLGEYNKKFRKSDDFKAKIPEDHEGHGECVDCVNYWTRDLRARRAPL